MSNKKNLTAAVPRNRNGEAAAMAIVFIAAIAGRLLMFLTAYMTAKHTGMAKGLYEYLAGAGDVPHYVEIASGWYQSSGETANNIVFFPLMPMLMKLFHVIFRDYVIAGIFVSYVSFGIMSCFFYKLLKLDYDDEKTAGGMLAMFMGVFGIFYISAHTESLFIMLIAMGLYYMRKKNWLAAGVVGFFASLSRTQGMVLFIPVVYEIVIKSIKEKKFDIKSLFAILIPMGYLVYLILNKAIAGDYFKFIEYQADAPWYNEATWISESMATSYAVGKNNFALSLIIYWPQIIGFFIAMAAIFAGLKNKVKVSYLLFLDAYTGVTYFQSWMISGGRYITACLPLYIVFAAIDNKYVKNTILLIEGLTFMIIAILWFRGYAIM